MQRNVEKSTANSQKILPNDDEDMAQHNINDARKNLIAKLSLKRSKVLQALEIIYRGVGSDNLKKSLSDDRVQTAVQEYKDMKSGCFGGTSHHKLSWTPWKYNGSNKSTEKVNT